MAAAQEGLCQPGEQLLVKFIWTFILFIFFLLLLDEISFFTDVCVVIFKPQIKLPSQIQILVMILFNISSSIVLFQINPYGKGTCDCITSPPHVSLTVTDGHEKWYFIDTIYCSQNSTLALGWSRSNCKTWRFASPFKVRWSEDGHCYPIHSQVMNYQCYWPYHIFPSWLLDTLDIFFQGPCAQGLVIDISKWSCQPQKNINHALNSLQLTLSGHHHLCSSNTWILEW